MSASATARATWHFYSAPLFIELGASMRLWERMCVCFFLFVSSFLFPITAHMNSSKRHHHTFFHFILYSSLVTIFHVCWVDFIKCYRFAICSIHRPITHTAPDNCKWKHTRRAAKWLRQVPENKNEFIGMRLSERGNNKRKKTHQHNSMCNKIARSSSERFSFPFFWTLSTYGKIILYFRGFSFHFNQWYSHLMLDKVRFCEMSDDIQHNKAEHATFSHNNNSEMTKCSQNCYVIFRWRFFYQ